MAEGVLPHFARLASEGHYQALPTTNPAQSPVAWATFATGLNPGDHGIFDFLRRNPETYAPEYSISEIEQPEHVIRAFGYQLPLAGGTTRNRRVGTPFWVSAEREGHPSSVLRVPVTYPPDPISRMLSGMGVPDLLGTQGTFTFYTTEEVESGTTGGRVVGVEPQGDRVETTLEGPPHPFYQEPVPLAVPLEIEAAGADRVRIVLGDAGTRARARDLERLGHGRVRLRRLHGRQRARAALPGGGLPRAQALRLPDSVPPGRARRADLDAARLRRRARAADRALPHHRHARGDLVAQRGADQRPGLPRDGRDHPRTSARRCSSTPSSATTAISSCTSSCSPTG